MNKTGIYVHVPWCKRRCPYCDFYFVVGKPSSFFIDCLKEEFDARKESVTLPSVSLYFGGGTPSLLPVKDIDDFITFLKEQNALTDDAEITLEANPEDLTPDYINDLKGSSINRISLGAQSFCDKTLQFLGRKHTAQDAYAAIERIKDASLRLSVDLIIGVPGESLVDLEATLCRLLALKVSHFSTYLLTIEEKTHFQRQIKMGKMPNVDEEGQVNAYKMVQNFLLKKGFEQYDISSFAYAKDFSIHNQLYWGQGEYLGLGPGAHSMMLLPDGGVVRLMNQRTIMSWLSSPTDLSELVPDKLDKDAALRESLAFGLRNMAFGMSPKALVKRHQSPLPSDFFETMEKYKKIGWLDEKNQSFTLTKDGALFADAIMGSILGLEAS